MGVWGLELPHSHTPIPPYSHTSIISALPAQVVGVDRKVLMAEPGRSKEVIVRQAARDLQASLQGIVGEMEQEESEYPK